MSHPRFRLAECSLRLISATALVGVVFTTAAAEPDRAFVEPLESLTYVTSTFGEYRDGYFHAGIDLGTHGRTGWPVRAVGDGSVVRVRASGVGYGRAIYFRLDEGPVVVYAHLSAFADDLAAYVEDEQDRALRYEVDLYPDEGRFRYAQGDVIAKSGDSGAGPPHLHFEVRNGASDIAANPQVHGFMLPDVEPPRMKALWVAPASFESTVEGGADPVRVHLREIGAGRYLAADTLDVSGELAISAELHDTAADPQHRLGVYRLNLIADGMFLYEARLDSVPWADKREVDLVYQRGPAALGNTRVRRLHRPPGSTLSVHRGGDGIVTFDDGAPLHRVEVVASDVMGNVSRAELVCRVSPLRPRPTPAPVRVSIDPSSVNLAAPVGDSETGSTPARVGSEILHRDGGRPPLRIVPNAGYRHVNLHVSGRDPMPADAVFEVAGAVGYATCSTLRPSATELVARFSPAGLAGPLHLRMASERSASQRPITVATSLVAAPRGEPLRVEIGGVAAQVPAGATYGDAVMWIDVTDVSAGEEIDEGVERVSVVARVAPTTIVLRHAATVSFPVTGETTGVGVYRRHPRRGTWSYLGGAVADGRISAQSRRMGEFALVRDLAPPVISRTSPRDGESVGDARPRIGARISDVGSGFTWRHLEITLDGDPLVAEWDPESRWLRGRPRRPLAIGTHSVTVSARDRSGNAAQKTFEFTVWQP